MVRSAAQLIRRQGVSGTGLREIVADAEAPRGSLQHYFPGGKEELVGEALRWMGGVAAGRVRRHVSNLPSPTPGALLAAVIDDWRVDLTQEGFAAGCPLLAAAADSAGSSAGLRDVLSQAFADWEEPIRAALVDLGVPVDRAPGLATLVVSALEGAIILCRIRRELSPLDVLETELGRVLDAARRGQAGPDRSNPEPARGSPSVSPRRSGPGSNDRRPPAPH
jgi:AcrR family transcriptional regulator